MIVAMTFDPNHKRMLFRNKFVQTEGYLEDQRTGTMSARGLFGTMRSGGILANAFRTTHKNVANTNVVHCGDTLYALWEGGLPYALDPLTLENKYGPGRQSETNLDGLTVTDNFAAHLRYDPKKKVYVNFAVKFDPNVGYSTITLFELDQETFRSCTPSSPSFVSKGPGLIHDFILTENYCIFNINQCKLDGKNGLKALLGLSGFAGAIDIDADVKETSIVLVPRYLFDETTEEAGVIGMDYMTDERIIVCKVPNHFNFHFGNAYEDEHGHVVFDTVQTTEISLDGMSDMTSGIPVWDLPNPFALVAPNTLVRYTLDVENRCMAKGYPPKTLSTRIPEFPSLPKEMSTRKHRYLYPVASHADVSNRLDVRDAKGSGPAGAIQKVDTWNPDLTETFVFEPFEFPGETVFAPKVGRDVTQDGHEDAGYLLVHVVNGKDKTTDFLIFDVEGRGGLERGPILRQRLPTFFPHMLHGNFFEGVTFDFDAAAVVTGVLR
jgi:all-trans-8'-apo-beta-carotenal 15,15'-oxygenase